MRTIYSVVISFGCVLFCWISPLSSFAQEECDYWTTVIKKSPNKIIRQSRSPIPFQINEKLNAELTFSNSGEMNALLAELTLYDKSGYFVDLGSMLSLHFSDNSRVDIFASRIKSFPSVAFFMLLKPSKQGAKKVMAFEDQLFYNKLTNVNLTSLSYTVAYHKRTILVSEANAELIKIIVRCLVQKP